jgi:hypothetical protein
MKNYFQEKQITITDADGAKLKFFMRPIKIKEMQIINRISVLAKEQDGEEFTTPMLLALVIDCLSLDGRCVPVEATNQMINHFIDFNFPDSNETTKTTESDRSKTKKKSEPLSFFIDFLVNQGHTVSDIMEMTLPQFNELIIKAGERLNPASKVRDPLEVFKSMGLPIRKRGDNGR